MLLTINCKALSMQRKYMFLHHEVEIVSWRMLKPLAMVNANEYCLLTWMKES